MDGLSRWDFVLWIVVAYIAIMALVRLMVNHRDTMMSKLRSQMAAQPRRKLLLRSLMSGAKRPK